LGKEEGRKKRTIGTGPQRRRIKGRIR